MPEIQVQIDSLRLAFSADISRPFELKPTFPYGSPSEPYQPSPPPFDSPYNAPQINQIPGAYSSRVGYSTNAITPPISATTEDSKADLSQLQAFGMMQPNPINQHQFNAPLVDENSWDPTRIFQYGNHATLNSYPLLLLTAHAVIGTTPSPLPHRSTQIRRRRWASRLFRLGFQPLQQTNILSIARILLRCQRYRQLNQILSPLSMKGHPYSPHETGSAMWPACTILTA